MGIKTNAIPRHKIITPTCPIHVFQPACQGAVFLWITIRMIEQDRASISATFDWLVYWSARESNGSGASQRCREGARYSNLPVIVNLFAGICR